MATALPRHPTPHRPEGEPASKIQSLKERLVQRIVDGDREGAESMREQLRIEQLKHQEAANVAPEADASTAVWLGPNGERETVEMTATPEARAYFDQCGEKTA